LSSISAAIEASLPEKTAAYQHEFCGKTHTQRFLKKLYSFAAVGLAAGMAVGFFLGVMVTRHDEPIVVIDNARDETLRSVYITTDFAKNLWGVPDGAKYCVHELQPHSI
jgi:hypothetical protein